jgi:hypothetical protein
MVFHSSWVAARQRAMSSSDGRISAQVSNPRVATHLNEDQTRGGLKGGLPMCEGAPLVTRTGLSVPPTDEVNAISTRLGATKLKQLSAQLAAHAESFAVFCVSPFGAL